MESSLEGALGSGCAATSTCSSPASTTCAYGDAGCDECSKSNNDCSNLQKTDVEINLGIVDKDTTSVSGERSITCADGEYFYFSHPPQSAVCLPRYSNCPDGSPPDSCWRLRSAIRFCFCFPDPNARINSARGANDFARLLVADSKTAGNNKSGSTGSVTSLDNTELVNPSIGKTLTAVTGSANGVNPLENTELAVPSLAQNESASKDASDDKESESENQESESDDEWERVD